MDSTMVIYQRPPPGGAKVGLVKDDSGSIEMNELIRPQLGGAKVGAWHLSKARRSVE